MGGLVTSAAPDATLRIQLAGDPIYEVASLSNEAQLKVMRDLVGKVNNPITRAYGALSSNNKLAFWYQLSEWMRSEDVVSMPLDYQLSARASAVFDKIVALEFGQQIAVLRLVIGKMGMDPLLV
ncbi:orange carotenoid protein N-terminal domain-containing protein [Rubidibacter lacunae]|uniref:orange carotenoid protein N-terminal domain-containing protein n=1 Tax=Rubidibacter lacunae TaxID=582514 RepID=UPI000686BFEC|nr:orange carotenoid protein N-terminal domain-containing protein [Rubidibacter lacunae]